MDRKKLDELIETSDLAGLVRFVDGVCTAQEWDALVEVRNLCRHAEQRGKQLFGVVEYAEYRTALDAPGPYAAEAVEESHSRFTLGPLWEVASSSHTWDELEAFLTDGPKRAFVGHDQVLRGNTVDPAAIDLDVIDIPLQLRGWEPSYPVATYHPDKADFGEPDLPAYEWRDLTDGGERHPDPDVEDALYDLVRPWADESNGRIETVAVDGDRFQAVRALGPSRVRWADLSFTQALAHMAWAGGSGGALGRRRGAPAGRLRAWWAAASAAGIEERWPVDPEVLREAGEGLKWARWEPGANPVGWSFHFVVEDPIDGIAWALTAQDSA